MIRLCNLLHTTNGLIFFLLFSTSLLFLYMKWKSFSHIHIIYTNHGIVRNFLHIIYTRSIYIKLIDDDVILYLLYIHCVKVFERAQAKNGALYNNPNMADAYSYENSNFSVLNPLYVCIVYIYLYISMYTRFCVCLSHIFLFYFLSS